MTRIGRSSFRPLAAAILTLGLASTLTPPSYADEPPVEDKSDPYAYEDEAEGGRVLGIPYEEFIAQKQDVAKMPSSIRDRYDESLVKVLPMGHSQGRYSAWSWRPAMGLESVPASQDTGTSGESGSLTRASNSDTIP